MPFLLFSLPQNQTKLVIPHCRNPLTSTLPFSKIQRCVLLNANFLLPLSSLFSTYRISAASHKPALTFSVLGFQLDKFTESVKLVIALDLLLINPQTSSDFMVTEDNCRDGALKRRPVLTDVTNRPLKRPFSSISSDSPHKSGEDGDSQFAKQVCLGAENLVKKKCQLQFGADTHDKDKALSQPKGKNPCFKFPFCSAAEDTSLQNTPSQKLNLPSNIREENNLLGGGVVSTLSENSTGFGEKGQGRITCGVSEGISLTEGFNNRATESDDRDLCVVDKLTSSKCGVLELPTISASHDSKFPGLERCAGLKGDVGANSAAGDGDLLKTCTCSFCTKAAYIWSDLHYQDVKGRLSALKKSQKEASMMVQKFSGLKETVIGDQQNSAESSELELSLMDQWKSLFVQMENTFAQESGQLESSFETLKNLRDNCKNDLELIDNSHFDNV